MKKIQLEWNFNCKNDDYHEVRCEHFKINNGKFKAVYECEECDYYYTEITDYPNMIQNIEFKEELNKIIKDV